MHDDQIYRTPAEVRRTGNRLAGEASLYLRQHARNPVDWQPWGPEALARAQATDRPIFLSSGYASCHWCHVMEHEVFESDAVAEVLNREFVCIKVDREESPDVDAAYMEAVQALTGGGGWPMSVFLTPDLKPFFGGTYIPHDRFLEILARIAELWSGRRAELEQQAETITRHAQAEPAADAAGDDAPPGEDLPAEAVRLAQTRFDSRYGGLAGPMKFPVPVRWTFLLHWWRRSGDPDARRMLVATLEAMARGGLRDHVGGGFHRYTVDAHWTVPHFEKMLYDNAQLASLYLEAGAALARPDFTAVGLDTLEFMARDLGGADGPCFASLDADSADGEGTFYVWTREQITAAVGEADGALLAELLGVTDAGNHEHGASVLTRRADLDALAEGLGRTADDLAGLFARHRRTLRDVRDQRPAPGLDRKIVTAWNGLVLTAFARGFMASGDAVWRERAVRIADYLHRVHTTADGGLRRASNDGRPVGEAVLEDHALLAVGLLDLFQITGDVDHLLQARALVMAIQERFARPQGGWYSAAAAATPLGRRPDLFDSVLPAGGSAAVNAMLTLGAATGETRWRREAGTQLAAQAGLLRRAGLEMSGWLTALLRWRGPLHEVVVAGDPLDPGTRALLAAAWTSLSPGIVVVPLPASGATRQLLAAAPALAGKQATGGATAYVCREGSCAAPTVEAEAVAAAIGEGWSARS